MRLVEADDVLALARRNAQIDQSVALEGVLVVDDEPMAIAIEHNLIKVLGFDAPVSLHTVRECVPISLRDVQCAGIIVGIVWPPLLIVTDVLWLAEPGALLVLLHHAIHVLPGPALALHFVRAIINFTLNHGSLNQVVLGLRLGHL